MWLEFPVVSSGNALIIISLVDGWVEMAVAGSWGVLVFLLPIFNNGKIYLSSEDIGI